MSRIPALALILATAALAVATRHAVPGDAHVPLSALFSFAVSAFREPLR